MVRVLVRKNLVERFYEIVMDNNMGFDSALVLFEKISDRASADELKALLLVLYFKALEEKGWDYKSAYQLVSEVAGRVFLTFSPSEVEKYPRVKDYFVRKVIGSYLEDRWSILKRASERMSVEDVSTALMEPSLPYAIGIKAEDLALVEKDLGMDAVVYFLAHIDYYNVYARYVKLFDRRVGAGEHKNVVGALKSIKKVRNMLKVYEYDKAREHLEKAVFFLNRVKRGEFKWLVLSKLKNIIQDLVEAGYNHDGNFIRLLVEAGRAFGRLEPAFWYGGFMWHPNVYMFYWHDEVVNWTLVFATDVYSREVLGEPSGASKTDILERGMRINWRGVYGVAGTLFWFRGIEDYKGILLNILEKHGVRVSENKRLVVFRQVNIDVRKRAKILYPLMDSGSLLDDYNLYRKHRDRYILTNRVVDVFSEGELEKRLVLLKGEYGGKEIYRLACLYPGERSIYVTRKGVFGKKGAREIFLNVERIYNGEGWDEKPIKKLVDMSEKEDVFEKVPWRYHVTIF